MPHWNTIVCIDWGKSPGKRRAWAADVAQREIAPLDGITTLGAAISWASAQPGRTLIGIDAVLGIPASYFDRARNSIAGWSGVRDFPSWLVRAVAHDRFLSDGHSAAEWCPDRPFISVPRGTGSLSAFWKQAGCPLLREVDRSTGAKSVFVVSGIPGTVGAGTRELWKELAPLLTTDRAFGLWPFDGSLAAMCGRAVVLGEIYPRVCYALALAAQLPAPLQGIAKTQRRVRDEALAQLRTAEWPRVHGVRFFALERACDNEDDFDAMMSAAGLLRCLIEAHPLECEPLDPIEGGILGLASIRLRGGQSTTPRIPEESVFRVEPLPPVPSSQRAPASAREFRCPIAGCLKVFSGSHGGWDAHVASMRQHPDWHPTIVDHDRRKELFRSVFGDWFR
jgi:hypothetical protein